MGFRAYAVRPHVVVSPDAYRPDTPQGRALVLHELGHIKQQAPLEPERPFVLNRSTAHELNASQLGRGEANAAMPMAANVVAGDSDTTTDSDVRREYENASRDVHASRDVFYRRLPDNTVEVVFEPKAEGQIIIDDADDPADLQPEKKRPGAPAPKDLPKVRLPNGELAVQRETKKLVAYNTRVVAIFPRENIKFNRFGQPIGISKFKPIAANATTTHDGLLVQTETNITRIGKANADMTDVEDARLQKRTDARKEYRGAFSFTKKPGSLGEKDARHDFKKLETSGIQGSKIEDITTEVEDLKSGRKYVATTHKEFEGVNKSYKGKAEPQKQGDPSHYVLAGISVGHTEQDGTRREVHGLRSGRGLVIESSEGKLGAYTIDVKSLVNAEGIEQQPFGQKEKRAKEGKEAGLKKAVSTVYQYVPVMVKGPDGKKRKEYHREIVQQTTAKSFSIARGSFQQETAEDPDVDLARVADGRASKEDKAKLVGASASGSASVDRGSGLRALNISGAANAGWERKAKGSKSPDVPAAGAAPIAGKADLAAVSIADGKFQSADGLLKAKAEASGSLTDSSISLDGKVSASLGKYEEQKVDPDDPNDQDKVKRSTLFGIFAVEQMRGATTLAGALFEGKGSLSGQRGTKGARIRAAQANLSLSGNLQVGAYNEERLRIRVKPDPTQIDSEPVKLIVQTIDPILDMTFNYHTFWGLEAKADVNFQRGGDTANPTTVGASAFLGGRAGIGIDGKLEAGRPIYSKTKSAPSGSVLGALKGDLDATVGLGAAWKSSASIVGSDVVVAGEGGLSALVGGKLSARAEFDLYKLVNVGIAVAKNYRAIGQSIATASVNAYQHDESARAAIASGAHKRLGAAERVALVETLFLGWTSPSDQQAIVTVLEDAKSRGDLDLLVRLIGGPRLWYNLSGPYYVRYRELLGP